MAVSYSEALAAYRRAVQQAQIGGPQNEQSQPAGPSSEFGQVLRQETQESIQTLREGEKQSLAAAAGTANINDVVMAMSQAEMTLQTVVTLRDRAVQAYQEILRMPI